MKTLITRISSDLLDEALNKHVYTYINQEWEFSNNIELTTNYNFKRTA